MLRTLGLILLILTLSGCDRLGIPDPAREAAAKEEESKAIGGACRHSGRALEDCYTLNPGASKAAVFAGWREMNDYMTQNKIDAIKPEFPSMAIPRKSPREDESKAEEAASEPVAEESASARRRARRAAAAAASAPEKN